MTTRRDALRLAALGPLALAAGPAAARRAAAAAPSRIRFAVSTYSYWHFEEKKYPVQKVIEQAPSCGVDPAIVAALCDAAQPITVFF